MGQFEFTLNKIIKSERIIDSFPVIMGVNAFAGVLSEFISSRWLFMSHSHQLNMFDLTGF